MPTTSLIILGRHDSNWTLDPAVDYFTELTEIHRSRSEAETLRIGELIGRRLHPPCLILLHGELGAGKTTLTRALALGLGLEDASIVHSPSFTLVNQYPTKGESIYHIDLYRLDGLSDLYSIGMEEILSREAVIIVEWAEKLILDVEGAVTIRILVDPNSEERRIQVDYPD